MQYRPDRLYTLASTVRRKRVSAATLAESSRYMPNTHGLFSFAQTPFLRLPTECVSNLAEVCRVVLKTPAQVGKTTLIENMLGWICTFDPANTLLILDTLKTGQRMSKNRLRPFLRDTCGINAREDTNPDKSKEVCNIGLGSGANLVIGSSNSASDLCSMPVKYLCGDELDRWADELEREGDPLSLAFQRQMRFRGMALLTSTPTIDSGRINTQFKLGTMETWCAVCECGALLPCHYDDIDFTGPEPVVACPDCGAVYTQAAVSGLPHRFSPPANPQPYTDEFGRVCRSFEIFSPLCHAFYTWAGLREEERAARAQGQEALRSFRNTRLGEVYIPPNEIIIRAPDLMTGLAHYSLSAIPSSVVRITAGIDTQDDGFAIEVLGWTEGREKLGLGWHWIGGALMSAGPWRALYDFLTRRRYTRQDGHVLPISASCMDSGGHFTQDVYAFCARTPRLFPIKGYTSPRGVKESLIRGVSWGNITKIGRGTGRVHLYSISVTTGKDYILEDLIDAAGGGRRTVWTDDPAAGYTESYFDEMTAERRVETKNGARWELLPGRRNEALDCRVYAMAAHDILSGRRLEVGSLMQIAPGMAVSTPAPPAPSGTDASLPSAAPSVVPTPPPASPPASTCKQNLTVQSAPKRRKSCINKRL